MKPALLMLTCLLCAQSWASDLLIATENNDIPVQSSIEVQAEYVAIELTLSTKLPPSQKRHQLMQETIERIEQAAYPHDNLLVKKGGWVKDRDQTQLQLLAKINDEYTVATAHRALYALVDSFKDSTSLQYQVGPARLAIGNPEMYRSQIIRKIMADIAATKSIIGSNYSLVFRGLENPVRIRHQNEDSLALFIEYELVFQER